MSCQHDWVYCICEKEKHEAEAHRTAVDLVLAHLKTYLPMIESGTPAAGILYMIKHNITAMREWTPDQATDALAEATAPSRANEGE